MKKMTRWMVLGLCLLLPACALGVTEGTVEDAPMVTLDGMRPAKEQVSYLPDETMYAGYGDGRTRRRGWSANATRTAATTMWSSVRG